MLTYHVQVVFTERSRPARESILKAAREEFAAVGFDRSTVRSVAAKAGADPAMVIRYYGSKEGLFAAATNVDLALPTPGEPADLGRLLGRHFVELWEGSRSDGTLQILLRSAAASPEIAARIRAVFADQVTAWVESAPRVASEPNPQVSSDSAPPISSDSAPPISSESARPISPRTDPPISSESGHGDRVDHAGRQAARVATYVLGTALCRYILELPPIAGLSQEALAQEVGSALQLLLDDRV